MASFVFAYRSRANYVLGTPERRDAWKAWFDSIGAHVADIGKPVSETSSLGDCGPDTRLGGYSIITADDLEAAVALAKGCPHLDNGGGVEVGAVMDIPG